MSKQDERNLTLIESTEVETAVEAEKRSLRHTNPIAKKFLDFHFSEEHKFSVKDLFKRR